MSPLQDVNKCYLKLIYNIYHKRPHRFEVGAETRAQVAGKYFRVSPILCYVTGNAGAQHHMGDIGTVKNTT